MRHPTFFDLEASVRFFKTILLLILACGVAQAQNFQATVVGQVVDPAGAAVAGAKVTITAQDTGRAATATTIGDGGFVIPQLPPGVYDLNLEAAGFKRAVKSNLTLETVQTQRINFQLETGAVNDTITVSAETPPINTDTSSKGEVIIQKQVQDLPLNGRDFTDLAFLAAGIYRRPSDDDQGNSFSAAGTHTDSASFTLDGVVNRADRNGGVGVNTSVESIREFSVSTSTYSAEYGRTAGAQVNVVSKSGTNQFHGSLFDYLRNDVFDARTFFQPAGEDKTLKRNQFGGSLGGPITLPERLFGPANYNGRDRTFFLFSYEGTRERRSAVAWQAAPRLCSLDAGRLRQARSHLTGAALRLAMEALRREADIALKAGPFSVTRKERIAPGGDKHDYLSLAPYWWPDPKSKDGLPYIRRDGETNPDNKRGTDAPVIVEMAGAVETLAIAYYFTGEGRYAERAALLIRAWFLDPATKMNPNFRYAQAIPGRNDGRGAGLIESRHFIKVVDAVGLLGGSGAWTDKDREALAAWFREFINWMQSSPNGKDEAQAKNNHGSWYAAQLACFALFIGDRDLARKTAEAARDRIAWQIEPDGKQPHELQRTRALGYSAFNLVALMTLAEAGKQAGVDLYGYQTKDGRDIRRALDYLAPYADATREWPHQQINEMENARRDLAYLLRRASLAFRETKYEELLEKHLANEVKQQRWQLLWPR